MKTDTPAFISRENEFGRLYECYLAMVSKTEKDMNTLLEDDGELLAVFTEVNVPMTKEEFCKIVESLDQKDLNEFRKILVDSDSTNPNRWVEKYADRFVNRLVGSSGMRRP